MPIFLVLKYATLLCAIPYLLGWIGDSVYSLPSGLYVTGWFILTALLFFYAYHLSSNVVRFFTAILCLACLINLGMALIGVAVVSGSGSVPDYFYRYALPTMFINVPVWGAGFVVAWAAGRMKYG